MNGYINAKNAQMLENFFGKENVAILQEGTDEKGRPYVTAILFGTPDLPNFPGNLEILAENEDETVVRI